MKDFSQIKIGLIACIVICVSACAWVFNGLKTTQATQLHIEHALRVIETQSTNIDKVLLYATSQAQNLQLESAISNFETTHFRLSEIITDSLPTDVSKNVSAVYFGHDQSQDTSSDTSLDILAVRFIRDSRNLLSQVPEQQSKLRSTINDVGTGALIDHMGAVEDAFYDNRSYLESRKTWLTYALTGLAISACLALLSILFLHKTAPLYLVRPDLKAAVHKLSSAQETSPQPVSQPVKLDPSLGDSQYQTIPAPHNSNLHPFQVVSHSQTTEPVSLGRVQSSDIISLTQHRLNKLPRHLLDLNHEYQLILDPECPPHWHCQADTLTSIIDSLLEYTSSLHRPTAVQIIITQAKAKTLDSKNELCIALKFPGILDPDSPMNPDNVLSLDRSKKQIEELGASLNSIVTPELGHIVYVRMPDTRAYISKSPAQSQPDTIKATA